MRSRRIGWGLAAAVVVGCASATGPSGQSGLALAEGRWHAHGPNSYEFELRTTCFCPPEYLDWHRIRVMDDAIVAVVRVDDQVAVPAERWDEWFTIDELFVRIRQFTLSDIFRRLDATFHPTLGFPQDATLVAKEGVADAGVRYEVRAFAALP